VAGSPPSLVDLLWRSGGFPEVGVRFLDRQERERWLAWPTVLDRARRVAGGLVRLGLGRGDRVALILPTGPEFLDALFGALLAGGVPAPLYPPARLGRLDEYLRRTALMISAAGARVILTDRRIVRLVGEVVRRARPPLGCVCVDQLQDDPSTLPEVDPAAMALVQFSSGTTADPKPIALSHRAVAAQAALLNGYWPARDSAADSGVSWLPLYHDMGLVGTIMTALERPGTVTLIPPELFVARPALWSRAISRYGATISTAPNFAYARSVDRVDDAELEGVDLTRWRVALCGGETGR